MADEGFKRKLTAILSADAVEYSRLMGDDDEATVRTLTAYREVLSTLIQQHNGTVLDSPGDNLLAEFVSVVDAVQCGVAVQKEIKARNDTLPENRRMQFRIGINLGDVIQEEGRIYGDGVNIAARLEGLAEPGGICISKTAFDHIESKLPYGYDFLGDQAVKNISRPVGAYRVLMDPRVTASGKPIGGQEPTSQRSSIPKWAIAAIVVMAAFFVWQYAVNRISVETASVDKMAFPLPDKPSIAVLPFDNMSGDPDQDYLADGISENIITALSYIPQMFVIARNSSFTYKGKPVKVQQASEELGVRYILEGSVLRSGDKVRVTAQLIDALTGAHIWSERYDRRVEDIFDLLDKITLAVTVALQVKLTDGEQARMWYGTTRNFEAWGNVVKGMGIFYIFGKESMANSRKLFERAIEIDPEYAFALTMLAWTHKIDAEFGFSDSKDRSLKLAKELAEKSVVMNDKNPNVHSLLSHLYCMQGEHGKAVEEGRKAIAFGPNDAEAHLLFGEVLYWSGMFEEAVERCETAIRLHPHTPLYMFGHTIYAYYWAGRYNEAVAMADRLIDRSIKAGHSGGFWYGYQGSAISNIRLGRDNEAQENIAKYLKVWPGYNLAFYRSTLHYKDQAHTEQVIADLRKAGAPENPPAK